MVNTAIALLESTMVANIDLLTENTMRLNQLEQLQEQECNILKFTPEKVIVCANGITESYIIEFSNNLERLMNDDNIDIQEALDLVAEANDISARDCTIIVDESALGKLNFKEIIENTDIKLCRPENYDSSDHNIVQYM